VRWRTALVGVQACVATALLVGATLLLVSFWRLGRVELGFAADGVWTVEMRLFEKRYLDPAAADAPGWIARPPSRCRRVSCGNTPGCLADVRAMALDDDTPSASRNEIQH
jgi:hypothetical protein